jgi:hypothetical protein
MATEHTIDAPQQEEPHADPPPSSDQPRHGWKRVITRAEYGPFKHGDSLRNAHTIDHDD